MCKALHSLSILGLSPHFVASNDQVHIVGEDDEVRTVEKNIGGQIAVRDLPGTYNSDQYVWVPKRDQLKKIAAEKGINEESFKALKEKQGASFSEEEARLVYMMAMRFYYRWDNGGWAQIKTR